MIAQGYYSDLFKHAFVIGSGLAASAALVYVGVKAVKSGLLNGMTATGRREDSDEE